MKLNNQSIELNESLEKENIVYFFYTFNFYFLNIERSSFPKFNLIYFFKIFPREKIMSKVQKQRVQTFGRKKTATAVAVCSQGKNSIFFLFSIEI